MTHDTVVTQAAPPRTGDRSLARHGIVNLGGAFVAAAINVALVIIVTRTFAPSTAGIFFSVISVFLIVETVAKLGTTTGLVYFLSRNRALQQPEKNQAVLVTGILPVLAVSALGGAVLFEFAPPIASAVVAADSGDFVTLLRVSAVLLPVAALSEAALAATRGFGEMRSTVVIDRILRPTLQLALMLIVALTGSGYLLSAAWAGPYLVAAALSLLALRRLQRQHARGSMAEPVTAAQCGSFWRFTAPRAVASVAQLALQRLDIVLVAALRGPAEAAIYTAATRFLVVGQLGSQAISLAVQPHLGVHLAREDRAEARQVYRTGTAWLVLLTWPLYLLAVAFGPYLLTVFGPGYVEGGVVVVVLCLTMLVATGCGMVDMVLSMAGRTSWNLANSLVALTVNVLLNLLLIPPLGILGAAIAWAVAILVNNLLPLAQVGLTMGLHPFGRATLTAAVLSLACFGVPSVIALVAGDASLAALVVAGLLGTGLFAAGCWQQRGILKLNALRELRSTRAT